MIGTIAGLVGRVILLSLSCKCHQVSFIYYYFEMVKLLLHECLVDDITMHYRNIIHLFIVLILFMTLYRHFWLSLTMTALC